MQESACGVEQQFAVLKRDGLPLVDGETDGEEACTVIGYVARQEIVAEETVFGSTPEQIAFSHVRGKATGVLQHREHYIAGFTLFGAAQTLECCSPVGCELHFTETSSKSADEAAAVAGEIDAVYVVATERRRVVLVVVIAMERNLVGRYEVLVTGKETAGGSYPDFTLSVARDETSAITRDEGVGGEFIACAEETGGNTMFVAFHDIDAILKGGQPDSTVRAFVETVDLVAAEAVDIVVGRSELTKLEGEAFGV